MATLGIWIGAVATLAAYSYLYKDNLAFEIAQNIFVGYAAAHMLVVGVSNIQTMAWTPLLSGKIGWLVPIILGVLLYSRFVKNYAWLSRLSLAYLMGIGAAVDIKARLEGNFIRQIRGTILPLNSLDNIIIVFGTVCTLTYFFFFQGSRKGVLKHTAMAGRWLMMVAFGAAFGNTVMSRMSLLVGRMQYLFGQWIPVIPKR